MLLMLYVHVVWSCSDVLDADADMVNPKPDVYLDDLYSNPLLPVCSRETRLVEKLS